MAQNDEEIALQPRTNDFASLGMGDMSIMETTYPSAHMRQPDLTRYDLCVILLLFAYIVAKVVYTSLGNSIIPSTPELICSLITVLLIYWLGRHRHNQQNVFMLFIHERLTRTTGILTTIVFLLDLAHIALVSVMILYALGPDSYRYSAKAENILGASLMSVTIVTAQAVYHTLKAIMRHYGRFNIDLGIFPFLSTFILIFGPIVVPFLSPAFRHYRRPVQAPQ